MVHMKLLEVRNLSKFFGGLAAVNNVNLHINEGEIFGLIGPNGAGKTTFYNVVCGIYKPDLGNVLYKGEDITGLRPHDIVERGIGRTFQKVRLFHRLTVFENVEIGEKCVRKRLHMPDRRSYTAEEALKVVGLLERKDYSANSLPMGDLKLLEIALALTTGPSILLLDEPLAGMNEEERRRVTELIRELRDIEKITILIVEHNIDEIMRICDRIAVLNEGELIAIGKPKDIAKDKAVIEAYLGR